MKKTSLLISLGFITSLAGCGIPSSNQVNGNVNQTTNTSASTNQSATTNVSAAIANQGDDTAEPAPTRYTHHTYGFSLEFPQTWQSYTTKSRTLEWGTFGTSDSIDFGFTEQDSIFNISIHTKEQWKGIESDEGPQPTYLGENGTYVFGYSGAQDAFNETMAARKDEVESIVKTFKVN